MTRARIRNRFDLGRMRVATAGPGSDPRTWVTTARVDDDPDALTFDSEVGWLVDVTFIGGDLAEEGPVPCRVAMGFGGEGSGILEPPALGCEVIVVLPEGDPNANPVIIGYLDNGDGCGPPEVIFGFPVTEETAAFTHYVASSGNVEAEYEGSVRLQALGGATIAAPTVTLAGGVALGGPPGLPAPLVIPPTGFPVLEVDEGPLIATPAESYVRGDQFASDLDQFAGDLSTFLTATGVVQAAWALYLAGIVALPAAPFAPLSALASTFAPFVTQWGLDITAMNTAVTTFRATLVPGTMLSEKIRGD